MAVENEHQQQLQHQNHQQSSSNNKMNNTIQSKISSSSLSASTASSAIATVSDTTNCTGILTISTSSMSAQNSMSTNGTTSSASSSTSQVATATINGTCSNINNNHNNNNNNNNNSNINNNHSNSNQISNLNTTTSTLLTSNKSSETSSNASVNGSIKKVASSNNVLTNVMNSSSREDITSIGGGSSINSHQSTTNNTKDNLHHNFYNGSETRNSEINYDDDGLGPLPPKWEKAYTESGELYFIDHNTGTSHWLDPRLSKFQKKSLEDCSEDELPYGWEKIHDPQYGTYFIDHVNRRTQYENPVLEAKRRAEQRRVTSSIGGNDNGTEIQNHHLYHHHHQQHQKQQQQQQHKYHQQTHSRQQHDQQQKHQRQQSEPPQQSHRQQTLPYTFTRNPSEMRGERITTTLLKSSRGLGITIVGGDDGAEEFLQIKSIVANGPAWLDGKLQTGDILVYVNDICVLGYTHHEMVNVFQSILPGETVTLEVCRGYPLPFDPNDPNTEVVTMIAVEGINSDPDKARILMDLNMDGNYNFLDVSDSGPGIDVVGGVSDTMTSQKSPLSKIHAGEGNSGTENFVGDDFILYKKQPEILNITIVKGVMGFGFTIADSAYGQKVKKILDRNCCKNLQEGDVLLEINNTSVKHMSHSEVVQVLKDCPKTTETILKVQRGHYYTPSSASSNFNTARTQTSKLRKSIIPSGTGYKDVGVGGGSNSLYRSKTPTADLYSTQPKEILPIRPKTPLVDTRRTRVKTPSNELNEEVEAATRNLEKSSINDENKSDAKSNNSLHEIDSINNDIPYMDPFPKLVTSLSERLAEASMLQDNQHHHHHHHHGGNIYHNQQQQIPIDHHNFHHHHLHSHPSQLPFRTNYENSFVGSGGGSEYNYNPPSHSNSVSTGGFIGSSGIGGSNGIYSPTPIGNTLPLITPVPTYHHDTCYCFECQDYNRYQMDYHHQTQIPTINSSNCTTYHPHSSTQYAQTPLQLSIGQNGSRLPKRLNDYIPSDSSIRKGFTSLDNHPPTIVPPPSSQHYINQPPLWKYGLSPNSALAAANLMQPLTDDEYTLSEVTLERQALGFGFRIVGGTEEGSQVTVGHIVPGGSADGDPRIATGDEILSIDGVNVLNASHHKVVSLMGEAALRGQVTMILRRRVRHPTSSSSSVVKHYPYDVIVSRNENEGFGFVIISSSNQYYGSTIGKLIPGSPADRCGELKVGDRIIAVNRIDIIGMSHGDVVNLIKESGLHVRLTIGHPKDGLAQAQANTVAAASLPTVTTTGQPSPLPPPALSIKSEQQEQLQHTQHSYANDRPQLIQNPQL